MTAKQKSVAMAACSRLPPFGRQLHAVLNAGRRPANCVFCFVGTGGWEKAEFFNKRQAVLLLPPGNDPADYHRPVRGLDCLVARVGETTKREILLLMRELLAAGARRLVVILVEDLFGKSPIVAGSADDAA